MMNDSYKGKGYGTTAVKLMIQHIIEQQKIDTVFAEAKQSNLRCLRMLETIGFKRIYSDEHNIAFMYQIDGKHIEKA